MDGPKYYLRPKPADFVCGIQVRILTGILHTELEAFLRRDAKWGLAIQYCVLPIFHLETCPLFSENYIIHYSCRLYCWKFWYCHNLGTNLAAVINLLFHSGISSLLRFWSGHIYSIDTIWRNSLRLLSYHDKMLAIQRIIQRFQCTT